MQNVRQPAVAGRFYPKDPVVLDLTVGELLASIPLPERTLRSPKALIVPHAGYIYSGQTAAKAYALLRPCINSIERVLLLGPTHRVAVEGIALPSCSDFETPLGLIPIDQDAIAALKNLPQIVVSDAAHAQEHSLEVQLPFLQKVLGDFKCVPLAVGKVSIQDVAQVLNILWGGPETLIVISSDLSHYHGYEQARQIDTHTVESILAGTLLHSFEQACGAVPIDGLLLASKMHQIQCHLIDVCNSGDTAGDRVRVVGYASFAFIETDPQYQSETGQVQTGLAHHQGSTLPSIARAHIGAALGLSNQQILPEPWLSEPGAVFVTLTKEGRLRGCIGSLQCHRSLFEDLQANAIAAAFHDPRFAPVTADELEQLHVEISVIGPSTAITFASEIDALNQLSPSIDGLILEFRHYRSTFLPQVWKQIPDRRQFMAHLKVKAGLPADFWSEEIRLFRYQVTKWSEPEMARAAP